MKHFTNALVAGRTTTPQPIPEVFLPQKTRQPKIISYEGSSYKTDFWEGQGREFEDITERNALRRLLPPTGGTIIEIGAGFGRLGDLYQNYEQVILLDYSLSLLKEAKATFGDNPKYRFVGANVYNLPLVDNVADTIVMIRVAHLLESVDEALVEIHRVLQGGETFIMEFANKRNAKSIARFLLRKQSWSPFDRKPYEFVPLNFDFHPGWMLETISEAGFRTEEELAISNFRVSSLKRRVSPRTLARIDNAIAGPGAALKLSPSILTKNISTKSRSETSGLFQCPKCRSTDLKYSESVVLCPNCGSEWPVEEGIIDFRYPRPDES
jgi:ubiquinone/menaquinone biosynthesis C-methylase UbiE